MEAKELKRYEVLIDNYKKSRKNAENFERKSKFDSMKLEYQKADNFRYLIDCMLGDITEEKIKSLMQPLIVEFFESYYDKNAFKNYIKELIYSYQTWEAIIDAYEVMDSDCLDDYGDLEEIVEDRDVKRWATYQLVFRIDGDENLLGSDYWYEVCEDLKKFVWKKNRKNQLKVQKECTHYSL